MKAVKTRARLAIAIFFLALLSTMALSLGLYWKTTNDLATQRRFQTRLQAALLATLFSREPQPSDQKLDAELKKYGISGEAFLFGADGKLAATAATTTSGLKSVPRPLSLLESQSNGVPQPPQGGSGEEPLVRTQDNLVIAETRVGQDYTLILVRPLETEPFSTLFYILAYQLLAAVIGIAAIAVIVRWLLRPYRRMVEAARGSPVRASTEMSESEFVVETFQALIAQLQAKEKELAELHKIERRRAEKSERFSERLISNIPSGLVVTNSRGIVTTVNSYAVEIFAPQEHRTDQSRVSSSDNGQAGNAGNLRDLNVELKSFFSGAPRMVRLVSECLSTGVSFRREEVDIESDGRIRHLGLSISPIPDAQHGVEAALCLITDITEVTELRERMKVQENLANLGEMAAGLAHEFKNSLATIQGYIQLLEARSSYIGSRATINATLEAALNEVRLLSQLVTDFMNFARPQKLTLGSADLREIIESAVDEVRRQIDQAGIQVGISGEFPTLGADELLLRRAFSNLIRNAVEAIDPASDSKLIEIEGSTDSGRTPRYAHVRIRDTGAGISADDLQRIFIPFFTTKSRGYGIGLALVQKIFIAHNGSVAVEKSNNTGTVFHCRLPLQPEIPAMEPIPQSVE